MTRHLTLVLLTVVAASLTTRTAEGNTQRDCSAFGWKIHKVEDTQGSSNPYRLAVVYRRDISGKVGPVKAYSGLPLCPGDVLETWHGAMSIITGGNNAKSMLAEGGSVVHFSDHPIQKAGTVTYLMPSGWLESIEAFWDEGILAITGIGSTVQVSMTGPTCHPTIDVAVSDLDDPFDGNSILPNPAEHGARLTVLNSRGRELGPPLDLKGAEWARLVPGDRQARRGSPSSTEALKRLRSAEPFVRAPLASRGHPTDEERVALAAMKQTLWVRTDSRPDEIWVNGLVWDPRGWSQITSPDGTRVWEAARPLLLPPGSSLIEVALPDDEKFAVFAQPSKDILEIRPGTAKLDVTKPILSSEKFQTSGVPVGTPIICDTESLGEPTGEAYVVSITETTLTFVGMSGGRFCMGSPAGIGSSDEHPQHIVNLSPFMMGRSEVTQSQWRTVVLAAQATGDVDALELDPDPSDFLGDSHPVDSVSWCEAVRFANALSRLDGREPVYTVYKSCSVTWSKDANGFRLPTEAEWEYAARAGTTTAFATGDDESALATAGWYGAPFPGKGGNSGKSTHPVCTAAATPWGLCDMHGNVWEWVWDRYAESYELGEAYNPSGARTGDTHVLRGGSWFFKADDARSASRIWARPTAYANYAGFRLVLPTVGHP